MSATEIFQLRRNNLAKVIDQLIETQQFKTGKALCEHFGLSAAHMTQLLNSQRQIGEKVARELEQQLGLAHLILDQPIEPKVNRFPVTAEISLFQMQVVQQQAFILRPAHSAMPLPSNIFNLQPQHYAIQVTGPYYLPSLKAGWWLICAQGSQAPALGWVCVYLANGLQLVLELMGAAHDNYEFQSLDNSKKVSFQKTDIDKIDAVIAMLPTTC